jgi:hypothetical protein
VTYHTKTKRPFVPSRQSLGNDCLPRDAFTVYSALAIEADERSQ